MQQTIRPKMQHSKADCHKQKSHFSRTKTNAAETNEAVGEKKIMARQRFLQPKRILSRKEYAEYRNQLVTTRRAEIMNKVKVGRGNLKRFEAQQRYSQSRTGKLGERAAQAIRAIRNPTRTIYARQQPVSISNIQGIRRPAWNAARPMMRPAQRPLTPAQAAFIRQRQQQQAQESYRAWAFADMSHPQHNTAQQVENELFNTANGGISGEGDRIGFAMSNIINPSHPVATIERAAHIQSRTAHFIPTLSVEADTWRFSNLLS